MDKRGFECQGQQIMDVLLRLGVAEKNAQDSQTHIDNHYDRCHPEKKE